MSFVLDNAIALAWCFEDEQTPAISALLDRLTEAGAIAPMLWPLEALNGLLMAERRRRLDAPRRAQLAAFFAELPVRIDTQTADQAWGATAKLAEHYRLTVYDAAYLELAQRRQLPLATLDRDLQRAATSLGVEVLGAVYHPSETTARLNLGKFKLSHYRPARRGAEQADVGERIVVHEKRPQPDFRR